MIFTKCKIVDVCDIYQPHTISTKEMVGGGKYNVYGANGIIGKYDKYNHEESEVVMACRGATCGALNITEPFSWINGNAMVIKPNGNIPILQKYLYYILLFSNKEDIITGTAQPQITRSNMADFSILLCDTDDQQRVVNNIEELFSKLDKGVEELNKIKDQLKIYRQSVLKEAFKKCDDMKRVVEVCEHVTDGDHMPPPKSDKGIPFIMISNIKNNTIDFENTNFVQESYYNNIGNKRTPQIGDVLYTVTGSYGIPVLIDFNKKFCFQRHIALLRPNNLVEQKFLYYVMQTPDVYQQATKRATGTAQKTVGLAVLRDIKIPYTSKELQRNIVCDVESKLSVCDKIEQTVNESLQKAESLRQSILKQAFEGKLV